MCLTIIFLFKITIKPIGQCQGSSYISGPDEKHLDISQMVSQGKG